MHEVGFLTDLSLFIDLFSTADCWVGGHRCELVSVVRLPAHQSPTSPSSPSLSSSALSSPSFSSSPGSAWTPPGDDDPVPEYLVSGLERVLHLRLRPDHEFLPPRLELLPEASRSGQTAGPPDVDPLNSGKLRTVEHYVE